MGQTARSCARQANVEEYVNREHWDNGERAYFEYHCYESPQSGDAEAWYHSHQEVTVLREAEHDGWAGSTMLERGAAGQPKVYKVRFADGLEWDAFEDELFTDTGGYFRPDPPLDSRGTIDL